MKKIIFFIGFLIFAIIISYGQDAPTTPTKKTSGTGTLSAGEFNWMLNFTNGLFNIMNETGAVNTVGNTTSCHIALNSVIAKAITYGTGYEKGVVLIPAGYYYISTSPNEIPDNITIIIAPGAKFYVPQGFTGDIFPFRSVTHNVRILGGQYEELGSPAYNWDVVDINLGADEYMVNCHFDGMYARFAHSLFSVTLTNGAWCNFNYFKENIAWWCTYPIYMNADREANNNWFDCNTIEMLIQAGTNTVHGISLLSGVGNRIDLTLMDFNVAQANAKGINMAWTANNNHIDIVRDAFGGYAYGGYDNIIKDREVTTFQGLVYMGREQWSADEDQLRIVRTGADGTAASPAGDLSIFMDSKYDVTAAHSTLSGIAIGTRNMIADSYAGVFYVKVHAHSSGGGMIDALVLTPSKFHTNIALLPVYANNAAAIAGGLVSGDWYRTGGDPDLTCVVH